MSRKLPGYAVEVSGCVLPRPVGGHPALDFCNTWAGWGATPRPGGEWLRDYRTFATWVGYAGLLDEDAVAAVAGTEHPAVLRRARRLRTALYGVLRHGEPAAFEVVAAEITAANAATTFTGDASTARFALTDPVASLAPLRAVALTAAELLTGPLRAGIDACPGDDCGWLFVNRSGRRTWCSMATCGNRAKVRAHAARAQHHR